MKQSTSDKEVSMQEISNLFCSPEEVISNISCWKV